MGTVKYLWPLILLLASCAPGSHKETSLLGRVERATERNGNGGLTSRAEENRPTVAASRFPRVAPFLVVARTSVMEKFPCERCHKEPLATLVTRSAAEKKKAHWNIPLDHASDSVLRCATCHGEQTMSQLQTINHQPVSFDHSYQVCGQCHSKQLADWAGGAHGKRLDGWAPPRVVESCAGCHDPHRPAIARRWPARAARQRPH
jgi:hypothetical protein